MPAGPGRGYAKSPSERVRRNKDGYDENGFVVSQSKRSTSEKLELPEWDGEIRGPELYPHPEGNVWHSQTLKWWDTWRKSPQAMYCIETDWESLFMGAIVYDRIMRGVSNTALAALTGELRKREGMFGAALEDRLRLNMGETSEKTKEDISIEVEVQKAVSYFDVVNKRVAEATKNASPRIEEATKNATRGDSTV